MNPLKKNIKTILDKGDKKFAENSVNTYYSRIKWLKEKLDLKTNDVKEIIKNSDKIIKLIDEESISLSTKTLLFVILNVLSKKLEIEEATQKKYFNKMNEYRDLNNFKRRENKISEKNAKNWTTWKEIEKVFDMIKPDSFENAQDKLIIGLYVLLDNWVLRLDFANMKVYNTKSKKRQFNWFYWNKTDDKFVIHLKEYKTANKFGEVEIDIKNEKLKELLKIWFTKFNENPTYLLLNYKDKKTGISEASLSHRIVTIFHKYLKKDINNQLMRQIKETSNIYENADDYNKLTLNEKMDIHKKLLHGYETANEYAKKS